MCVLHSLFPCIGGIEPANIAIRVYPNSDALFASGATLLAAANEHMPSMSELSDSLPEGHQLFYPLAEMAMLIALRTRPAGEPLRTTIDKVRKRLVYATKNGDLQTAHADLYFVPQVIAWSQKKWPGKFHGLPAEHSVTVTASAAFHDEARGWVIPGDLAGCQEALEGAQRENEQFRTELKAAHAEIERLRPIAEKYEQIREKNIRSAKLPRKGSV